MKRLSLLFLVTLFAVTVPAPSARADVSVPVDFFYDALSPYGDWVYTDNYGYVWQPAVAQQAGWSPYSDGYWAYTDAGWTWISSEDFGWATYHYGRWIRMYSSWFWVPGYEWAPAWVSWRQSDDYIGWAPLPPEARWSNNIGFNWWTDSYYDIGPSYYSFVPMGSFATRSSLRPFIMDRRQNVTYVDRSVNITNISYRQNVVNNIFVGGPDPARIDRFGGNQVRRLTLRRDDDNFRRDWLDNRGERPRGFGSLSRIDRDHLIVAAPSVRHDNAPGLPPRVRERFERPEIDRGWRDLGDANATERLRGRQREDLVKAKGEKMPDKTPHVVTGKAPPPAVGRALKPEERGALVERPDPRRVEDEVRKAVPQPNKTPRVADEPPTPGSARQSGTPGRDGPDGRRMDGEGRGPQGRPAEPVPGRLTPKELGKGMDDGVRPGPPGVLPNEGGERRRGGAPSVPEQPQGRPEPKGIPPQTRPEFPGNRRSDGPPEGRRPQRPDDLTPPKTPAIPMPEARPETRVRPAPMPTPEAPRVRPAPMPQPTQPPQVRPSPSPERRPEMPVRPMPQPRQDPPQARPQPSQSPAAPQAQQQGRPSGSPQGGGQDRGGGYGPGEKRGR